MCQYCMGWGRCGKPLSPEMQAFYDAPRKCLFCGAVIEKGASVCGACGAKAPAAAGVASLGGGGGGDEGSSGGVASSGGGRSGSEASCPDGDGRAGGAR